MDAPMRTNYTTVDGTTIEIEYNEANNAWLCTLSDLEHHGERLSNESLAKLKESIDRRFSPKAKSRRVAVLVESRYEGGLSSAVATSITPSSGYVRISRQDGTREQVSKRGVYADTPENRELAAQIKTVVEQQRALHKTQVALEGKLTHLDPKLLEDA